MAPEADTGPDSASLSPDSAPAGRGTEQPDWHTMAATAHAWRHGAEHNAGGGGTQLLRPVDLRHTGCLFRQPGAAAPSVRMPEPTVGPIYPLPPAVVRRVIRRHGQDVGACASCVDGTDVFELLVQADGSVRDVEAARARTTTTRVPNASPPPSASSASQSSSVPRTRA